MTRRALRSWEEKPTRAGPETRAGGWTDSHALGWDQPHLQGVPRDDQRAVMLPPEGVQLQVGLPSAGHLHGAGGGGSSDARVRAATRKPLAWVTDAFRLESENRKVPPHEAPGAQHSWVPVTARGADAGVDPALPMLPSAAPEAPQWDLAQHGGQRTVACQGTDNGRPAVPAAPHHHQAVARPHGDAGRWESSSRAERPGGGAGEQ